MEPETVKLVVVGDGSVGKTCILVSYTSDSFPTDYVPTVFDNYTAQVTVNGKNVNLSLVDTAGQETYNNLRTLSYGMADVFLIVYSVVEQSSFENTVRQWIPELNKGNLANVPKIVCGNKIDMRDINNKNHVQHEVAQQVLQPLGVHFFECSALTQEGLKTIFDEAIKFVLTKRNKIEAHPEQKQKQKKSCCQIF